MGKLNAYVVEDEKHVREYLLSLLKENFEDKINVSGYSGSVLETIEFLKTANIDLLFLDIELSDGQVFDLLKNIDYRKYRLVFITGYSEHAIKAIKYSAIDYLLKPIITSELKDAVEKVIQLHGLDNPILNDLISRKKFELADYLIVNNQHSIEKISLNRITHLEADGIYTIIYHDNGKTVSSKPLGVYEEVLSGKLFNRCHKSYIVNRFSIKKIEKGRGLEITLHNGSLLPVAIRKKEEFMQWFKD